MPGDRGHRGGLAQNRVLASRLGRKVQNHVSGRQSILARGSLGWQNRIPFRSGRKQMSEQPARSCSSPNELRLLYTPGIHSRFEISKVWRTKKILIRRTREKNSQAFQKKQKSESTLTSLP